MKRPIVLSEVEQEKKLHIPNDLYSHLITHAYMYLQPNGWFHDHPRDEEGITPWMTYPAIAFLKNIINKQNKVLEYGCGYSTVFFSERAGQTVAVEHNPEWYDYIKEHAPSATIHLVNQGAQIHPFAQETFEVFDKHFPEVHSDNVDHDLQHGMLNREFAGYASTIYHYPKGHFDVIVLDGMARLLTGIMAVERIAENGIIILDNSDRWQYNLLQKYLADEGYKRIDFWGPGFNNHKAWCTSIYGKNMPFNNNDIERPIKQGDLFV
jgi:CheY-like chemotaxis protein